MEFYRVISHASSEEIIQSKLTLSNLEAMSNQLFVIGEQNETEVQIGSVWGEFTLSRSVINGGLRFALTECPNALAWTITTGFPPKPKSIVVHLTINRQQKCDEFIDEVEEFLDDHTELLTKVFTSNTNKLNV